jgi:hypothetical protein
MLKYRGLIVENINTRDMIANFIKNFANDLCSLELLMFFGRHPNARFNRTAVLRAISAKRFDTGIALKHLMDQKLVITFFENGITLYALSKEELIRTAVFELKNIDRLQWQSLVEQILRSCDSG